jgi:hypothetical protein
VVNPFIEGRTNPHCTIVALMMWIIMIKAQSTHELVLRYTRPNRSNRSRHPVNERQCRKILPLNRMGSYYSVKWAVRGLMKPFEDVASYITIQPFKIYDLHDDSKQNKRPTKSTCLAVRQYWNALQT